MTRAKDSLYHVVLDQPVYLGDCSVGEVMACRPQWSSVARAPYLVSPRR